MSVLSKKIVWSEFVCMIFVVMQHAGVSKDVGTGQWYAISILFRGIGLFAVPFFALISGYFLSKHFNEPGWYGLEVGKRIQSVLCPYLVWCTIGFCVTTLFGGTSDVLAGRPLGTNIPVREGRWVDVFGLNPWHLPLMFPLWYLRALFVSVLVSPVIAWLARTRFRTIWIIVLGLCYLVWAIMTGSARTAGFMFCEMFFYFNVGVLIRMGAWRTWSCRLKALRTPMLVAGLAIVTLGYWLHVEVSAPLNLSLAFAIPLMMAALWNFAPICADATIGFMRKCVFPIFVWHIIFFIPYNFLFKSTDSVVIMAMRVGSSVILSVIFGCLMRRCVPRFCQIAFGGR